MKNSNITKWAWLIYWYSRNGLLSNKLTLCRIRAERYPENYFVSRDFDNSLPTVQEFIDTHAPRRKNNP